MARAMSPRAFAYIGPLNNLLRDPWVCATFKRLEFTGLCLPINNVLKEKLRCGAAAIGVTFYV